MSLFFCPAVSILPFVFVVVLSPCMCCACLLVSISCVYFPHCDSISLSPSLFSLSFSICPRTRVYVCCVGSHVVDLGLKLWVITPIMNHHALFRLSSPTGIDCIMKLSFSLSNTLCPHITLLTNRALCTESDNDKIYIA